MKVVCFGDSNTYGYDPRSYFGGRYDPACRWVDILARETGWEVINAGENGRQIPAGSFPLPRGTDLLIVMLGTNDLLQGFSAEETAGRMDAFLSGIAMEKAKIMLIAPPPFTLGEWVADRRLISESITLAVHYRALAERLGISFGDAGGWNMSIAFDGVHFTESGHQSFAQGLLDILNQKQA